MPRRLTAAHNGSGGGGGKRHGSCGASPASPEGSRTSQKLHCLQRQSGQWDTACSARQKGSQVANETSPLLPTYLPLKGSHGTATAGGGGLARELPPPGRAVPPQNEQRLHRQREQWSVARLAVQNASQASILESVLSRGVQVALPEQKPHALQSHRVQWAEACRSRQKLLHPSTLPSSLAAGLHALPTPPTISAAGDDDDDAPVAKKEEEEEEASKPEPAEPAEPAEPPQKPHALQAQAEQCTPLCSTLHHCAQASYLRSLRSCGLQSTRSWEVPPPDAGLVPSGSPLVAPLAQ